ncbi:MAG: glycoside hydrolase family 15 protein [Acidobacteriota bacterium]|nr:glycoside hydrolase family 15 protein [Acidobacteriota bacterium]
MSARDATAEHESERYRPISDYALIGDSRSAALISREGSIDWLCWPRFNSGSVFGRLLDADHGGYFAIHPTVPYDTKRRYLEATNVLETTFVTASGSVVLLDLMPALTEERKATRLLPLRELLRRVECIAGEVPMVATCEFRPDYGRGIPSLQRRGTDSVVCMKGPEVWHLRSEVPMEIDGRGQCRAAFAMRQSHRFDFALSYESHAPAVHSRIGRDADEVIEDSISFWKEWSAQLRYEGPYQKEVLRSALTLKLLTYAPSGAIVAAPTTSLPEHIGGVRNWDYRYCWLRDASFTVAALYDCGFETEGGAFVDWLLYSTRLTQPKLQILYDVFGESDLPEMKLDNLAGYRGSRPVRTGNGAHDQFQLDVYGEVLRAIEEFTNRGELLGRDAQRMAVRLAEIVVARWREPDNGIWEKRSGRKQHVHAKIMAWAALDSAQRMVENGRLRGDASRWRRVRDEIKAEILDRGFNRVLRSFVSEYDGDELDASLLYASRVGFLEGDDSRLIGTIDAIRGTLGHDDLVYRYRTDQTDDGLPGGEGAFLACSFWLVEALVLARRLDDAREIFEALLSHANDVGLFSEEVEATDGRLLGNFPQALTHMSLINAALCLDRQTPRRGAQHPEKADPAVEERSHVKA